MARKPADGPEVPVDGMGSVYAATRAELDRLGATATVEGQIALNLAAVLDDRAGIQGVAATAKRLESVVGVIRDQYKPREAGRLAILRGAAG